MSGLGKWSGNGFWWKKATENQKADFTKRQDCDEPECVFRARERTCDGKKWCGAHAAKHRKFLKKLSEGDIR